MNTRTEYDKEMGTFNIIQDDPEGERGALFVLLDKEDALKVIRGLQRLIQSTEPMPRYSREYATRQDFLDAGSKATRVTPAD